MIDFLLDTNIVIYLINNESYYINYIGDNLKNKRIGISSITYVEILIGVSKKNLEAVSNFLTSKFNIIDLNPMTSFWGIFSADKKTTKGFRNPVLADILIASTAKYLEVPIVTNNPKDFKKFKGLQIVVP